MDKDNEPVEKEIKNVTIPNTKKATVLELNGHDKPKAIILNSGDYSYFRQIFNRDSLEFLQLKGKGTRIKDNISKTVVIRDLNEMVREGLFSPYAFIEFAMNLVSLSKH